MCKRFIAILLVFIMAFATLPVTASAHHAEDYTTVYWALVHGQFDTYHNVETNAETDFALLLIFTTSPASLCLSILPAHPKETQPDPFFHAMHGNLQCSPSSQLQAANLYVFVTNNPVMFVDPTGLARVNTVEYARAQGAAITNLSPAADGRERIRISHGGTSMDITVNSGFIQDSVLNNRFGWTNPFISSGHTEAVHLGGHNAFNVPGIMHTSVVIFAGHDSSLLSGNLAGYFRYSHFGMQYATIGGGSFEATLRMTIQSTVNRPSDVNLSTNTLMMYLASGIESASSVFAAHHHFNENYQRSLPYRLFPTVQRIQFTNRYALNGHNSNSLAHGLLRASGLNPPRNLHNAPGWGHAVPSRFFGN